MRNYQAFIFDLDGTLVNSLEDIADAMNRTLLRFYYPIHSYEAYKYFVGKGLKNLVYQCVPVEHQNEEDVLTCLDVMMEEYGKTYAEKTKLYPGIDKLLNYLTEKKIKMSVLSNKSDILTKKIAGKLLSRWQFELILGATDIFPRKPDPGSALFIAQKINISPEKIIYVGDTNIDMKTAVAAGMFPVGVTWGFRTKNELQNAGAELIIDYPEDILKKIFINN